MKFFVKASLVLLSVLSSRVAVGRAVPDDGCWHVCPDSVYEPVCGREENSTQVFGNECIMNMHNDCFETREGI
jgi:hypothetical protein